MAIMPTCDHPAANGACSRTVPDDDSRCFMHSGNGPPSSHGAPEDSQNALGNSGGGAPEKNLNAARHCGWSDPEKHLDRLREARPPMAFGSFIDPDGEFDDAFEWAKARVDERVEDYALVYDLAVEEVREDESVMEDIRTIVALTDQGFRSSAETLMNFTVEKERGYETADGETVTVTTETINPSWRADIRTSQRARNLRRKLGITGREVAQAKRERELAEQWRAALSTNASRDDHDQESNTEQTDDRDHDHEAVSREPEKPSAEGDAEAETETASSRNGESEASDESHTEQIDGRDRDCGPRPDDYIGVRSF